MCKFTLTQKARIEVLLIGRFINKELGKTQQKRYINLLDTAFHDIAKNPEIGCVCNDIREGYYKFGVGKHFIYYRYKENDQIEIVRILHNRIDIGSYL